MTFPRNNKNIKFRETRIRWLKRVGGGGGGLQVVAKCEESKSVHVAYLFPYWKKKFSLFYVVYFFFFQLYQYSAPMLAYPHKYLFMMRICPNEVLEK